MVTYGGNNDFMVADKAEVYLVFFINCTSVIMESRPPNLLFFVFVLVSFFYKPINKKAKTQFLCLPRPLERF